MSKLLAALSSVQWDENAAWLSDKKELADRVEACNLLIAVWARQLERVEKGAPALSFIREMQHAGHYVACCLGLALYKPAAGSMRSMLECALYFAYFRTHPAELQTLVRDEKFYVSKREIIEFFKRHVADFPKKQEKMGFVPRLEKWYSKTSAIVHGQIPGVWSQGSAVSSFVQREDVFTDAVAHFEAGALLVRDLFFCTIASELWAGFTSTSKKALLSGVSAENRAVLGLDLA